MPAQSAKRGTFKSLAGMLSFGRLGLIGLAVMLTGELMVMFHDAFPVLLNAILVVAGLYTFFGGWTLMLRDACRLKPAPGGSIDGN